MQRLTGWERRGRRAAGAGTVVAGLLAVAGCGGSSGGGSPSAAEVVRAEPAAHTAAATRDEQRAAADGTAAFGLDLYRGLEAGPQGTENLAVSPSSLADLLGMMLPGARGATAAQTAGMLHEKADADRYAMATGALEHTQTEQAKGDGATLRISNALWTQRGLKIRRPYLQTLASAYGTGVHQTDFAKQPERARGQINDLVAKETEGAVKDLFPPDSVQPDTRLVLTDAVYLKAKWQTPFQADSTHRAPFHKLDGSTATVQTMENEGGYRYATGQGWQAVELPYRGGHLAMDVLVPAKGSLPGFAKSLTPAKLGSVLGAMRQTPVVLDLPEFTFDSAPPVTGLLKQQGMRSAFDPHTADFSGIPASASEKLYLSTVEHKVHVAVDESGTTAAAGSGGGMAAGAARPPADQVRMQVDRPFVFVVRDTGSGRPLFIGQVTAPRS